MITDEEKQLIETLKRSFTRMEAFYKAKSTRIRVYEEKISQLESENAALHERLDKAIELPVKIGDTVYKVYDKCDGHNCPYNGYYGKWRCDYEGERRCEPFISTEQFCYNYIPFINKTVFTSKEAAEARLAELMGGK